MRILLLHNFYRIDGGADVYFFETKRILESQGHEVACVATAHEKNVISPFAKFFAKAPDFRSPSVIKRFGSIGKIIYSQEARNNVSMLIKEFQPEIVHAFGIHTHLSPSVLEACRLAGVPVVLSCNDYKHICPNYKLFHHNRICFECKDGNYYHAVVNRCCHDSAQFSIASAMEAYAHKWLNILRKNVHTFLFTSDFMSHTTEEFWGKETFRWRKIGNPFNSQQYPLSEEYGDNILFFGRLIEEKGVDVLLRAMQKLPDIKLLLVGDGPDSDVLKKLAKDLSLENVDFVGPKWGKELDVILTQTRFVVVPSVWHENFPYVILQSFAVGKPVVGTDKGGIPELIQDRVFGLISRSGDHESLADSIRELWGQKEECKKMGKAAKTYADDQFNDTKFYNDLMQIYGEILK